MNWILNYFTAALAFIPPRLLMSVLSRFTWKSLTRSTDTGKCVCLPADQYSNAKASFLLQWSSVRHFAHLCCQNQLWIFYFSFYFLGQSTELHIYKTTLRGFFFCLVWVFFFFFVPRRLKWEKAAFQHLPTQTSLIGYFFSLCLESPDCNTTLMRILVT